MKTKKLKLHKFFIKKLIWKMMDGLVDGIPKQRELRLEVIILGVLDVTWRMEGW